MFKGSYDGNLGWLPAAYTGYRLLSFSGFHESVSMLSAADKAMKYSRAGQYYTVQMKGGLWWF